MAINVNATRDVSNGEILLSTTPGIDLATAPAEPTLYTVPVGQTVVVTKAVVRVTAAAGVTGAAVAGIGTDANEENQLPPRTLTGLTALNDDYLIFTETKQVVATAGQSVKFGIDTAISGGSMTVAVDLFGYVVGAEAALVGSAVQVASTQTVNLNNTMTTGEMQAIIDAIPKNIPFGVTVTIAFAAGTYTLTQSLIFSDFFGGGSLSIEGDLVNPLGSLDRILDITGVPGENALRFRAIDVQAGVTGIRANITDDNIAWTDCFNFVNCDYMVATKCHAVGSGNSTADNSRGFACNGNGILYVSGCRSENLEAHVYAGNGSEIIAQGSSPGATPVFYAYVGSAGTVRKWSGESYAGGFTTENLLTHGGQVLT